MKIPLAAVLVFAASVLPLISAEAPPPRPKAGKPEIMHENEVKPGMKGWAWTVLQGTEPEPIPVEVIGISQHMWGPKQDIILAKMLGKALRTNVAKGMSGSPVYINGKLVGAVSLGLSQFSPDSICGITPIDLMLEINQNDQTRPADAKVPGAGQKASTNPFDALVPIDSPIVMSGLAPGVLSDFTPVFEQMGIRAVQGTGGGTSTISAKPVEGWQQSLNPGDSIATVLVGGDMGISAFGTVTYNDGKKVLAFGHPLFNLGPVTMPIAKSEVVLTLASQFQPSKIANAGGIVGALRQDRHSGIMGELGETSPMIPVTLKVRSLDAKDAVKTEKDFHFSVFVHQKWTPTLMMLTLYNSISNLNEMVDEATYRLKGQVEMNGVTTRNISLATMQATGDVPMPAPMALALWLGDKFNKLYLNNVNMPDVKRVAMTLDLVGERRVATIEGAWVPNSEVQPGQEVPVKASLRPYRGEPIIREIMVKIPEGIARGDHRILLSDADTLNRMQNAAGFGNRFIDLPQTVSLLNQERTNNRLYVALVQSSPTAYYDDKTMPSLPASVLNVMQAGRASNRNLLTTPETAVEQTSLAFDYQVTGSYSLRIHVK